MKAMKKALALGLALAMVVTAVPVTSAQAASTAKLSASTVSVAAGTAKKQTKSVKVTTPSTWKSVKVTASSSDKKIATVKVSGKTVKVTAVKKGSAKVTVKVSAKKSGKTVKKTLTAKVKVINAGLRFVDPATEVVVGESVTLTAKKCPKAAVVTFKSSDDTIATVDADGKVTAVKAGKVTITATSDYGKEVTTDVTVKKVILKDAKQTEVTKIVATVAGDSKDLKAGDFKITNTATNGTVAVKSATADKNDPTKITIETFTEMKDAKEYNVTFDGVTVKFTATDGTPAKVGIDKAQIPAASKEKIQAVLMDANDVVLSRTDLNKNDFSKGKVTSAVTLTKGYQEGSNIYLPAVGDTASIKVTYHTGTFGTDGKEAGNIEDTFTVTAVDPSLVNYNFALTIATSTPAWDTNSFKANDKIAMGADKSAYIRITKDNGLEIATENYADYTVESADKTKLIVDNTKLTDSSTAVSVHGVAEGSTYILVKKDGKTVASLPVTVLGKPVATTLELSKTSVTICTGSSVDEVVNVTVKDQYGDPMSAGTPTVTLLAKPSGAVTVSEAIGADVRTKAVPGPGKVTITGNTFANDDTKDLGSYTLKVTADVAGKKLDRTLNVNVVKNAATAQSYEVRIDTTEVDTTIGKDDNNVNDSDRNIKISVARMANGGAMTKVNEVIYNIKNAKGDVIAHVGETISGDVAGAVKEDIGTVKSCAAVSSNHNSINAGGYSSGELTIRPLNNNSNKIVKNLAAGTYTVEAKVLSDDEKKIVTVNGSFTIKDTQDSRVSFKILDNKFVNSAGTAITIDNAFETDDTKVVVYYDGKKQDNTKLDVSDVKGVVLNGSGTSTNGGAYIKTLKLYVQIGNGSNYVQITLNVNDQIAVCAQDSVGGDGYISE